MELHGVVVLLFAAVIGLAGVFCKVDETVVRIVSPDYVAEGLTIRQYSDGKDTVTAIFTAFEEDELVECHVEKFNPSLAGALLSHAVTNPAKEQQFLVQMDLARLGRKCRKFMRDIVSSRTKME